MIATIHAFVRVDAFCVLLLHYMVPRIHVFANFKNLGYDSDTGIDVLTI